MESDFEQVGIYTTCSRDPREWCEEKSYGEVFEEIDDES